MLHDIRWTSKKIQRRIKLLGDNIYRKKDQIPPFRYRFLKDPSEPPPVDPKVDDSLWDFIQPFDYWGNPRKNFILRSSFTIPDEMLELSPIALFLPIGISGDFSHPEAMVYIDGEPYAACDRHHQEITLPDKYCDGKLHHLALHGWTGIGGATVGDLTNKLKMKSCEVVLIDQPTRSLHSKARVAYGIAENLDENNPAKHHLLTSLDETFKVLDIRLPIGENFYASVPEALETLDSGIILAGSSLPIDITAIGHAHIDVAWLWTIGQTRQKAGRTFHNILRLMEQFPDFIFAQSQPQLYEFISQDFPDLFEMIKARVFEGRWETIGGMWVEADCNLSGPESLVRQFLLGRQYFREHFGNNSDSPVLWLPDVFGYAWNLPQLIKEAGLEYFFTIKIGWSQYNRLPYDSFWWQGLDGTKVLTHFSTTKSPDSPHAATYNSDASPSQTLGTWMNFQQKDYGESGEVPPLLMSYGYGDGGGGPTRKMLENIREMADFPGSPNINPGRVGDFFEKLKTASQKLPIWNGELYLEYHRGTYTTQARNKRANRKSEFLLHNVEFLATYASILDDTYDYPHEKITKCWKLVCLNQFHDIIPGSSIAPVYEESLEQYKEVNIVAENICNDALQVLSSYVGGGKILVNPTSFVRSEVIDSENGALDIESLQPYSILGLSINDLLTRPNHLSVSKNHLENAFLRVELNDQGDIIRIFDKSEGREVLPKGSFANQFIAFEDIPLNWDAWDIDIYYDDKIWLAEQCDSIEVLETGPLRVSLEIKRRILNSNYSQRISLSYKSRRIDFDTQINWQERQTLLKVAFPVDILSPTATYEIQWGNVERPTHKNTSWDWARFETSAQKWVDLSEGDYGVSLLNDCKYGHDIHSNVIRLTLLRGTTAPDPTADLGIHKFKYSLLPHSGRWCVDTVREAYFLNNPVIIFSPQGKKAINGKNSDRNLIAEKGLPSLINVDRSNIMIETVKRAENGEGIIVRLYEFQRQRVPFILYTSFPMVKAWRVNLLEEKQEEIEINGSTALYSIKPYQIVSLLLIPKSEEQ